MSTLDRRNQTPGAHAPLPVDYLKMVAEIFSENFSESLAELQKLQPGAAFEAHGAIYPDEVVLAVTLKFKDQIAANTVYASMDYDPRASVPSVQDLLGLGVDAIGTVLAHLLDPSRPGQLAQLVEQSLSALDEIPFEWSSLEVDKRRAYVKFDKSNPGLDQEAEDWLAKNDPEYQERKEADTRETEKLFVTGPKKGDGSDTVH